MRIRILSCGGTIDKVYFDANSQYQVGDPQIELFFREARVTFDYVIQSIMQKDSLDMNEADRKRIRLITEQAPETRILITHGTDTMADTAAELIGIRDKVVVLTGSMTPAQFRSSDAEFNIGFAVGALQCQPPGVYIAMSGRVFDAGAVRKNLEKKIFEEME